LIGVGLQVRNEFEQNFGFSETALALGEVSKVQDESPVDFLRQLHNAGKREFKDGWKALSLHFFDFFEGSFVLVLRVGRLNELIFQDLNSFLSLLVGFKLGWLLRSFYD
jgi:hypothetical protein